jgi:hypothetical protein
MNDLSTIVNRILTSNLNDSSAKVYLYLYCNASGINKSTRITNGELTKNLHMNIKTVLRSLAQLREFGYLEVNGMTSNRVIHCVDPYLINTKTIKSNQDLKKKAVLNKSAIQKKIPDNTKLEMDKWFLDYLNDTILKTRTAEIVFYLKKCKIETSKSTKAIIFKNSDPRLIPDINKLHFKKHIIIRREKIQRESFIEKRAVEYDRSHQSQIRNDLKDFYLHREHRSKFAEYLNCSYNRLSKYSIEFKRAFLSWIEPELF